MTRNEVLQWHILGLGLSGEVHDLGHPTDVTALWQSAREKCFECDRNEVLDALYTLPREDASLIKVDCRGEGAHPIRFERVRNTNDWPKYFTVGSFYVKVLAAGRAHYLRLCGEVETSGRTVRLRARGAVAESHVS